jgi:Mn2+/Fe2+ NRAMP family transporter
MVFSQAFQALILPAVSIPVFFLVNRKKLVSNEKAGIALNTGLLAVILFSLVTSYFAVIGLMH